MFTGDTSKERVLAFIRRRLHNPETALVFSMVAYIGIYLVWRQAGEPHREPWGLLPIPLSLAAVLMAWRASGAPDRPAEFAAAWRLLAIALSFDLAGDLVWVWYPNLGQGLSPAGVAYLAYYPVAMAAMLMLGGKARTSAQRLMFWLDAANVFLVSAMFTWFLLLGPVARAVEATALETLLTGLYPVGDLLILFAAGVVRFRRRDPVEQKTLSRLLVGFALLTLGDLAYGYLQLLDAYRVGSLPDLFWMLASVQVVFAARGHVKAASPPEAPKEEGRSVWRSALLPYIGVALAFLLLVLSFLAWRLPFIVKTFVFGAAAVAILVMARQVIVLYENGALLGHTRRLAEQLRESEARFRSLVQHSTDLILVITPEGSISYASPSAERTLGEPPEALLGRSFFERIHGEDIAYLQAALGELCRECAATRRLQFRLVDRLGAPHHVEVVLSNLMHEPSVSGITLNVRDVTERKALEEQLTHQAFHDDLTGLANRALFLNRTEYALKTSRSEGPQPAVLFVSLEGFKTINDTLGHRAADELLQQVAGRLRACVGPEETVARFGGDHFAILQPSASVAEAVWLAERLIDACQAPFRIEGKEYRTHLVAGVAAECPATLSADELLRNADVARYAAKGSAGRYALFEPSMRTAILDRVQMEADLARAIGQEELRLLYQPTVDIATSRIKGVEALVRWAHPDRGMVSPAAFIPLAEETGLIAPITLWVLREACRQAVEWLDRYPASELTLNVNLSGRHLAEPTLVGDVAAALAESGLPPDRLTLEVTETVLVKAGPVTNTVLEQLKRLGVRLAIDDFGTGYSSLSYLQRFPFDVVKIDRSFIEPLGQNPKQAVLARGIIELAHALSLATVAEGVERADQVAELKRMGCQVAQGYYFARPLDPVNLERMLRVEPDWAAR